MTPEELYKIEGEQVLSDQLVDSQEGKRFVLAVIASSSAAASLLNASPRFRMGDFGNLAGFS